jgi:hypothetical protein
MRCGVVVTDTGRVNSTPLHAARPGAQSLRVAAAAAGGLAAVAAAAVGTVALVRSPATGSDAISAARKITVTAPVMPLSESELVGLLHRPPDLGPFVDPARRASCLAGLGYPASTTVLGARQVRLEGRDAVILVLAADAPRELTAVAVTGTCSAADTGLLADTTVRRP